MIPFVVSVETVSTVVHSVCAMGDFTKSGAHYMHMSVEVFYHG